MNKQRDYWVICKRNSFALAILSIILSLPLFVFPILVIILVVNAIIWIILGFLFRKKSPKAISVSYTLLGAGLILGLINNIMNLSLEISDILAYLIYAYLFDCVRRAQKQMANLPLQSTPPASPTPPPPTT
jgi:phosphate/sulfate permease